MSAMKQRLQPAPVKIKHVDYIAVQQAIQYIAQRATKNGRHGKTEQFFTGTTSEHPDNENTRHQADAGKEPALPTAGSCQKRERRAVVVHAHHVEKPGDGNAVVQLVMRQDQVFGELVKNQPQRGHGQPQAQTSATSACLAGSDRHHYANSRVSPAP